VNGLRNLVFNSLAGDQQLNQLGLTNANLYPAYSRDNQPFSMEGETFTVLRWGEATRGIGPVNRCTLEVWSYDLNPDYSNIQNVLKRTRVVLATLISMPTGEGHVTGMDWQGSSPDLYDDLYNRYTRFESYTTVASGS
jgi:hypothetical protein